MKLEEARRDIEKKQQKRKWGRCHDCEHLDHSYKGVLIKCEAYQERFDKYFDFFKIISCKYKEEIEK